ncbi:MAG: phosphopentomutase [Clostridiales bacterium]|nr:phosphopentomutase [Clostridiales bacterium]
MKRVLLVVLDSVGAGALPDAQMYGDVGANTLGNIAKAMPLRLPNMNAMGFSHIPNIHLEPLHDAKGAYGKMAEVSPGKDTTTGHWEMAGIQLEKAFPTFPDGFDQELINKFEEAIGTKTLGNYASSGTVILDKLGEEHMRTGYPIVYTSADSVFQIAAHENIIPLEKLYEMCEIARSMLTGRYAVGRVIARPFVGEKSGAFTRTKGRKDFSLEPTGDTILDVLKENGHEVLGVGKIEDIFNHRGLTGSNHAAGNPACIDAIVDFMSKPFDGLCFANLVDTDMVYGHRRDVKGYRDALEYFDGRLPELTSLMGHEDLLIITADHGCDPTFHGTDHTREYVPLLVWYQGIQGLYNLGIRDTFSDVAATISEFFGLKERYAATSFWQNIKEA